MKKLDSTAALVCAALLAVIALQGAQAQTKPSKTVTRDELRACMNSESQLATQRQAIEGRAKQNSEEAAAIRAESAELLEEQKRIGEEDGAKMERFINRRAKPHNARVKVAQANAESVRADMEGLNKSLIAYNEQCGGISYSQEDKEVILKERETAAK